MKRRLWQAAGVLASLWAMLAVSGVLIHRLLWVPAVAGQDLAFWQRAVVNLYHVVAAPGYAALRYGAGTWGSDRLLTSVAVNAMSATAWVGGLACVLIARHRWIRWSPRRCALAKLERLGGLPNSSRRRFLVDAPLAVAAVAPGAGLARASLRDPWDLRIRRYEAPIADLPGGFHGLRLVQLSDTHLGPRVPRDFVQRAVEQALGLNADVYLLTGDYIHAGDAYIEAITTLLEPLMASAPGVGVLGNHDWYGDGKLMSDALSGIGVRMIDNGRVYLSRARTLSAEPLDEQSICIAGVGDLLEDSVDPERALAGVPQSVPRLLLSHNPDVAELPCWRGPGSHRVDLMISGHTHGGQVRIPLVGTPAIPSQYGQKYAGGLVRGPAFPVVISRGIGMSILPVRFNVPPEVVQITLVPAT